MVIDWVQNSSMSPKTSMSEYQVKEIFEKAGFVVEKTFDAGDHHYGIIFKKA